MKFVKHAEVPQVPASHEDVNNPGVWKKVLLTKTDLQWGQIQMLNWATIPGGSSFQWHYHEDMQEVFLLLRGSVQMTVAGQELDMQDGDCVVVQPGEVHQMTNLSSQDAEYIVFGISSGKGGQTIVVPQPQVDHLS